MWKSFPWLVHATYTPFVQMYMQMYNTALLCESKSLVRDHPSHQKYRYTAVLLFPINVSTFDVSGCIRLPCLIIRVALSCPLHTLSHDLVTRASSGICP